MSLRCARFGIQAIENRANQLLNSLAAQDDLPDESLTIRADVVSPGTRSNVVFA